MFDAKVSLSKLLTLTVLLNRRVITAKFFMLLTHAQMRHYLNRYKILQLIVQALNFLIRDVG